MQIIRKRIGARKFAEAMAETVNDRLAWRFPKGFLKAEVDDHSLTLFVGGSDAQVGFDGEPVGSGQLMDSEFEVRVRPKRSKRSKRTRGRA